MDTDDNQHVLINPQILEVSGEQTGYEGCLSIPGKSGIVTRPDYVKVKALNERGEEYVLEGEGLWQDAFVMSAIILMVFCTVIRQRAV